MLTYTLFGGKILKMELLGKYVNIKLWNILHTILKRAEGICIPILMLEIVLLTHYKKCMDSYSIVDVENCFYFLLTHSH